MTSSSVMTIVWQPRTMSTRVAVLSAAQVASQAMIVVGVPPLAGSTS